MIFEAKVDLWFLVLFYGLGIGMIVAAPLIRNRPRGLAAAGLLVVLGILFVGVGWRASVVEYVITDDGYLDATGWPLNGRIAHASEILAVEPSNDPSSSHAASLDRLRIDYELTSPRRVGKRHATLGLIFIAVEEELEFLDALASKDPHLVRTATGIRRSKVQD